MAQELLKKTTKNKKPVSLSTSKTGIDEQYRVVDGKSLFEVYTNKTIGELVDIRLGISTVNGTDGNPIRSLVLETKDKFVSFSLSKGFDDALLDPEQIGDCVFRVTKRMVEGDEQGKPSGPEMITFGKPTGITFASMDSLVGVTTEAGS